jgi:GAF domain-containing protein
MIKDIPDELLMSSQLEPERREMLLKLGLHSYVSVALRSRGKVLAAVTLVYSESGRRYDEEDLRLAEELAHRAATSLDNARLYHEAQEAVQARDSFLSVASHELNTPLTSLKLRPRSS